MCFCILSMKPLMFASLFGWLMCVGVNAAHPNLKPYPPADVGYVRYVIELPELVDESLRQVELLVGKTVMTDGVNRHFFGGKLTREVISGWGFNYYELKRLGPMAGTLMAPDPNAPSVERFVPVRHDLGLLRYNSQLPIVVYVPEEVEVNYRIWTTEPKLVEAKIQ